MVEFIFTKTIDYMVPTLSSLIFLAMDDLQSAQNPPYSKGLQYGVILKRFR